jgi:hypothetical protein
VKLLPTFADREVSRSQGGGFFSLVSNVGKLKKSSDLVWNRNRDLPACSVVSQSTALLLVYFLIEKPFFFPTSTVVKLFTELYSIPFEDNKVAVK